jgi:hypothetical protein
MKMGRGGFPTEDSRGKRGEEDQLGVILRLIDNFRRDRDSDWVIHFDTGGKLSIKLS